MWKRFVNILRCPLCQGVLELASFCEFSVTLTPEHIALAKKRGLFSDQFNQYVYDGLLSCHHCQTRFPITQGLPILVPYTTPLHKQFSREFEKELLRLPTNYPFPAREPMPGEQSVMNSFSTEWSDYIYDGVIGHMSYEDEEKEFLIETSFSPSKNNPSIYLEIGCGLGLATSFAHKNYGIDAVGVDLSSAAFRATQYHKSNPFLHFVQASAFHLPFRKASFDLVYSRGALHHTYSTSEAFRAVAPYCRSGGTFYLWVYGTGSINANWFRRAAYTLEKKTRPFFSRKPSSWITIAGLNLIALGYVAYTIIQRLRHRPIQIYSFRRALHGARDRFTPHYAHRHLSSEVIQWFQEANFENIQIPDWNQMPLANQGNYKRNVGVRGRSEIKTSLIVENVCSAHRFQE